MAAVRGDGANPFSEGRLCLRAQALTDLWKAPEGATEDGAGGDGGNGAGGKDVYKRQGQAPSQPHRRGGHGFGSLCRGGTPAWFQRSTIGSGHGLSLIHI